MVSRWVTRNALMTLLVVLEALFVIGATYLLPFARPPIANQRVSFGLASVFYGLATSLVLGGAWMLALWGRPRSSQAMQTVALVQRLCAAALVSQTVGLLLGGIGAQEEWGAYWSWDPQECWYLAVWLVLVGVTCGLREFSWEGRRACLAVGLAAAFAALVLFGAGLLLRRLGLYSVYWVG
jgi:ABC-type transport system involved in cytochrome c biogenesis permease subunit